jgi:hypothetical protein
MKIEEIFSDSSLKQKAKVKLLSGLLLEKKLSPATLIAFAEKSTDTEKATCIEALEFATKHQPALADENILKYVTERLRDEAPRIKWESAKVIGNIAHLFPTQLSGAIKNLLINSESSGTVVRWATASALCAIIKLKTIHNDDLVTVIKVKLKMEEDNAIRKKYLDAISP